MLQNQKQWTPAMSESLRPLDKNDEHPLLLFSEWEYHFRNTFTIYDLTENLLFYSWHGWHSCPKHNLWRTLVDGLIDNDERVASSKNISSSRPECINHTLFMTKMANIDILYLTKTTEKSDLDRYLFESDQSR